MPHAPRSSARHRAPRGRGNAGSSSGAGTPESRLRALESANAGLAAELEAARAALAAARQHLDAERAEQEWLSALLDSMNEEVYFTDTSGRYTYMNPAALRQFGHERVEGTPVADIVGKLEVLRPDGTPRPIAEAPPLRALAGEVVRDEEQLVRIPRTGELRHRQVSSAPVRNAAGTIIGSVSIVRDITELRRMNAALQSADQRKDEFIAMLAHELRNPLVPIRAGVELLARAAETPDLVDQIRPMMERQLGHVVRLIDDLLDVSRITSGRIEIRKQPVTVAALVANAVEANRAALTRGAFDLSLDLGDSTRTIVVDPMRLTQVISNLVQNATKFTPPGGRIAISARVEPGARPALVLTVADSGVGIPAETLPHVFDLFAQYAGPTTEDRSGLGIGLALARRLVELHDGTIAAHSDGHGRGSTFVIRLPIARSAPARETGDGRAADRLDGLRVLVVDDSRDAADATAMFVELLGAEVRTAYDARRCLETVAEFHPDVVLLDIGLPVMDGYEVCRRIRRQYGRRVILVALSGWGQDTDKTRAGKAGFDQHLTKPADPRELGRTIAALAGRRGPHPPAGGGPTTTARSKTAAAPRAATRTRRRPR